MNTTNLAVGQRVVAVSGCYLSDGRVVEITNSGVTVQTIAWTTRVDTELLHFDSEGQGLESEGTYECGPWELDRTLAEDQKW
jgi:hypothetical protein